jgi:hypothetical protein
MSLRQSLDLIKMVRPDAGTTAIDHEILAERASSLGAAEKRVGKAVAALAAATGDRTLAWPRPAKWCGNISCSANWSAFASIPT